MLPQMARRLETTGVAETTAGVAATTGMLEAAIGSLETAGVTETTGMLGDGPTRRPPLTESKALSPLTQLRPEHRNATQHADDA